MQTPPEPPRPSTAPEDLVWREVCRLGDLPTDGGGRTIELGSRAIALFNVEGRVYAVSDTCPHEGASLGTGVVVDGEIACPWHSFHFDLQTGRNTDGLACRIRPYPVRLGEGERVEVGLPG